MRDGIRGFSAVNVGRGYGLVVILTPADILRMLAAECAAESQVADEELDNEGA